MSAALPDEIGDNWLWRHPIFRDAQTGEFSSERYLKVLAIEVFVRDLARSLEFYSGKLGFKDHIDASREGWGRWIVVAPPSHGSAAIALLEASEPQLPLVGRHTGVTLITDDLAAQVEEWLARGVCFVQLPTPAPWGSHAVFEDVDGNRFNLIQNPEMDRMLSEVRRLMERRAEAERLAVIEKEFARRVQSRLFPQELPEARTLDYTGECIQARQVGGDYYDFLELRPNRLGIVVADVAGKGVSAALLMANLQANIRSQYAAAADDLAGFLTNVNRLFYKNTDAASYSTLFFADYDDLRRKLRYANCGHLPGFLLRACAGIMRLPPTCTVVGLFPNWQCEIAVTDVAPGDLLVLYTDGIVEAMRADDEEFGESRLIDVLTANAHLRPEAVARAVVGAVHDFTGGRQQDDITLVVGQVR
jgi:serine phosphatase RsbU (regulator of sigma subunit)/predicted enzyme related to lactoylglutathione lyase